jgi:hypothetical protein
METEGLIGFFVNTLVLQRTCQVIPVSELLGRGVASAYAHPELP